MAASQATSPAVPHTPLSLYVHLPWCIRKCPYCDFNSHHAHGELPLEAYTDALLADLAEEIAHLPQLNARPVGSIFFGGGTPSLFPAAQIGRILDRASALLSMDEAPEVTLEANPGTAEHGRFADYRTAGVNRLSIGVQSFSDQQLKRLGRIHDGAQASVAIQQAQAAGFNRINLDLMYGLPEQTVPQALADVSTALATGATHISHYELTIEPNTVFYNQPPALPDEQVIDEMREQCQAAMRANGLDQYEVSAYARPETQCRHNLNYWQFGDYIGIGAGAHGKVSGAGQIWRRWKRRSPRGYLQGPDRLAGQRACDAGERVFEFMLNALRLREGFTEALFETRTGLDFGHCAKMVRTAQDDGLIERVGADGWRPSTLGWRFLNDLQGRFLPETPA